MSTILDTLSNLTYGELLMLVGLAIIGTGLAGFWVVHKIESTAKTWKVALTHSMNAQAETQEVVNELENSIDNLQGRILQLATVRADLADKIGSMDQDLRQLKQAVVDDFERLEQKDLNLGLGACALKEQLDHTIAPRSKQLRADLEQLRADHGEWIAKLDMTAKDEGDELTAVRLRLSRLEAGTEDIAELEVASSAHGHRLNELEEALKTARSRWLAAMEDSADHEVRIQQLERSPISAARAASKIDQGDPVVVQPLTVGDGVRPLTLFQAQIDRNLTALDAEIEKRGDATCKADPEKLEFDHPRDEGRNEPKPGFGRHRGDSITFFTEPVEPDPDGNDDQQTTGDEVV